MTDPRETLPPDCDIPVDAYAAEAAQAEMAGEYGYDNADPEEYFASEASSSVAVPAAPVSVQPVAQPAAPPATAGGTPAFDVKTVALTVPTLLEASAGTGKTYSIKHLALRLIVEEEIPADQLLIVTFTKAATAELKARIRSHLSDALRLAEGRYTADDVEGILPEQFALWEKRGIEIKAAAVRLRAALAVFDNAPIYTIHGFCQKTLTNHAFSAGTGFDTEFSDDDSDLRRMVTEDFLRRQLDAAGSPEACAEIMAGKEWEKKLSVLAATDPALSLPVIDSENITPLQQKVLEAFVEEGPACLRALKAQAGRGTFDDMLVGMWQVLCGPDGERFADSVRKSFRGVMIDEFQDTDPVQYALFKRLFLDATSQDGVSRALFFVGDPKQAIYRFRSADLNTYLKARDDVGHTLALQKNFRSAPALVSAVNAFFSADNAFLNERLQFEPVDSDAGRTGLFRKSGDVWAQIPVFEIWSNDQGYAPIPHEQVLSSMASDIAKMVNDGAEGMLAVPAKDGDTVIGHTLVNGKSVTLRGVRAADVAVLVRTSSHGDNVRDALAEKGLRSRQRGREDVCQTDEGREMLRILRAFADPTDDGVLRSARATLFMGATASALQASDETVQTELVELFRQAGRRWRHQGVAAAFAMLFETCRVAERVLPLKGGEQKLTNYQHLVEVLHAAGRSYNTPAGLLHWYERAVAGSIPSSEDRQQRLASDDNLVSIVTIHSSKGLQYPVVYLPFGQAMQGTNPNKPTVYRETDSRTGQQVVRLGYSTLAESDAFKAESTEEYVRLAYVAMTRAESRLVLICPQRQKSAKSAGDWHGATVKNAYFQALTGEAVPDKAAVLAQIDALCAASDGAVRYRELDSLAGEDVSVKPQVSAEETAAMGTDPASPKYAAWSTASFTAIVRKASEDDRAAHCTFYRVPGEAKPVSAADDMMAFPRGPDAGSCLHEMLEEADFVRLSAQTPEAAAARRALAARKIDRYRLTFADEEAKAGAVTAAAAMLDDVLNTELVPGVRLSDVTGKARLSEMEFLLSLPSSRSAADLAELLRDIDPKYDFPNLSEDSLKGYLTGFIDLAFGASGRFWIVDWKSNAITERCERPEDFTQENLSWEMARERYRLQYLIYAVALRRFLRARLGSAFREDLIGGAVYVFLRGVRKDAPQAADGSVQGVMFDPINRPDRNVIAELDDFFAGA